MSAAQPQPEALRLAEAMEQRVIPRWGHATGGTPRQSGFAADAECQAAAAELRRLHAECEALRSLLADVADQARHTDYDWPLWLSREVSEALAARAAIKEQPNDH